MSVPIKVIKRLGCARGHHLHLKTAHICLDSKPGQSNSSEAPGDH